MQRTASLDRVRTAREPLDIIIVGGGATGLGAAIDAATRGHRVALFEKADFAKGTSSRSTKLVHGGVRYLRQGNVPLVIEALRERGRLARNAPHLVHPLAFVIPTFQWWEGPYFGLGMWAYDKLSGRLGLRPSRWLDRNETIAMVPGLKPANLVGGVLYYDGQFDDARLAVNLAQTAADQGADVLNYCPCAGLMKGGSRVMGVKVRDAETGAEFEVRSRVVINATGVFVDELRRFDDASVKDLVTVSQGIHVVLPRAFLPGDAALMVPKTADGRVLFAVPWHDCVIVGTTDTPRPRACDEPRALDEERSFLMEHARRYLAKAPSDADVLSVFAGLRPLVKNGTGPTAALSRDHTIVVSPGGLVTITGGKWTTYRQMAEDVVDAAEKVAGLERRKCGTKDLPLHGWTRAAIPEKVLSPYGSDAARLSALLRARPELAGLLHPELPYLRGEVVWHAKAEMARTVEDVLARRTRALLLNARASIAAALAVARLLAAELGHGDAWIRSQVEAYTALARGYVFTDPASRAPAGV